MQELNELHEAVGFLRKAWGTAPRVAAVMGSGLGDAIGSRADLDRLPYGRIPHCPQSGVVGHAGELGLGQWNNVRFCIMLGRVHFYEGHSMPKVVFLVRALGLWGVEKFVITNAAGAVNREFEPGDLMLIRDHINFQGDNPLVGKNIKELGPRFPDMSTAYDPNLIQVADECAREQGLELQRGVYIAVRGPSYETPAEIRMCRALGADAVGMSTVPETIALNHMKRKVLGISCITNMAAGVLPQPLVHEEVLKVTERRKEPFARLILELIRRMGKE